MELQRLSNSMINLLRNYEDFSDIKGNFFSETDDGIEVVSVDNGKIHSGSFKDKSEARNWLKESMEERND